MMFGQPFFKKTMGWLMPNKRPTDNMELAPDLPQEGRIRIVEHDALFLL